MVCGPSKALTNYTICDMIYAEPSQTLVKTMTFKERLQSWSLWQYSVAMTPFVCFMYAVTLSITSDVESAVFAAVVTAVLIVLAVLQEVLATGAALAGFMVVAFAALILTVLIVLASVAFPEPVVVAGAVAITSVAALAAEIVNVRRTSRFRRFVTMFLQTVLTYGIFELSNHLLVG